jgi:hypothetical protein
MARTDTSVVHRAMTALAARDTERLTQQLDLDVVLITPRRQTAGREAVAAQLTAQPYRHLETRIIPGRIANLRDRLLAQHTTVMSWRGMTDPLQVSQQTFEILLRDGLISRLELVKDLPDPPAAASIPPSSGPSGDVPRI